MWTQIILGLGGLAGWALSGYLVLVNRTLRTAVGVVSRSAADWEALSVRESVAAKVARDKLAEAQLELARLDETRAHEVLEGRDPAAGAVDLLNGLHAGPRDPNPGRR